MVNCRGRRSFANQRYRRLLWRPEFPSDLPPALRRNAEVMRHAAPQMSPHKQTWTIHASRRLFEVAPELCERGEVEELAANIAFQALDAIDCKCPREAGRRIKSFRSDLFVACSNLFEAHFVHQGAENVFGILNGRLIRELMPTIRKTRRRRLHDLILDSIEEWVDSHRSSFAGLDASKLLEIVGPAEFLALVPRLHLSVTALRGEDLEVIFYHLTVETRDIFGVMRLALMLLPVSDINASLGGTSWTLRRVLGLIEERRSMHSLRFLLASVDPPSLAKELLAALRERDVGAYVIRNHWSYMASVEIEHDIRTGKQILLPVPNMWPMVAPTPPADIVFPEDDDSWQPRRQRIFLTDGELRPFTIEQRKSQPLVALAAPTALRNSPWPECIFDAEVAMAIDHGTASPSSAPDAYQVGTCAAGNWTDLMLTSPSSFEVEVPGELPSPDATLPLDGIFFIDTVQALSHVLTFLQHAPPAFVGIDLEWSDPYPVSIIQIATSNRCFVIDTVDRTPLYMSVVHCLVDWLMKREETTKLFFGFPYDLLRLNLLFGPGRSFGRHDYIRNVLDLYAQRERRVTKRVQPREVTPLGREEIMGEAIASGDFGEVQRLNDFEPLHPEGEFAEQIFIVGGHHSLAGMAERYLGLKMDKSIRISNWNFRPLAAAQVVYAAVDAHVLLRLESAMRLRGVKPLRTWGAGPWDALQPAWWKSESDSYDEYRGAP